MSVLLCLTLASRFRELLCQVMEGGLYGDVGQGIHEKSFFHALRRIRVVFYEKFRRYLSNPVQAFAKNVTNSKRFPVTRTRNSNAWHVIGPAFTGTGAARGPSLASVAHLP
eukprot:3056156-Rhodomonas_salina.3